MSIYLCIYIDVFVYLYIYIYIYIGISHQYNQYSSRNVRNSKHEKTFHRSPSGSDQSFIHHWYVKIDWKYFISWTTTTSYRYTEYFRGKLHQRKTKRDTRSTCCLMNVSSIDYSIYRIKGMILGRLATTRRDETTTANTWVKGNYFRRIIARHNEYDSCIEQQHGGT